MAAGSGPAMPRSAAGSAANVSPLQHAVLEALEGATNYNGWVASLALPHLGSDPIEIGSGTGTSAACLLEMGLDALTVSDLDPSLVAHLEERFAGDDRVQVEALDLLAAPERSYSAVVAFNVLEHIEDDVAALRACARLVRPGGAVVLFVPAFAFAMSEFDRAIGHHRRYTVDSARAAMQRAGLAVDEARYVNAPGLLAWTVAMRLLRGHPRDGLALRLWDRVVIPPTRALESRVRMPFGQSVFAVGHTSS